MNEGDQQYSLIIKKEKPKEILKYLKIDIKNKKELPKRFEIYLIYDQFDKDKIKSIVFDGKVMGKMTNDKFKEILYSKLYSYLTSIQVPIEKLDTGNVNVILI